MASIASQPIVISSAASARERLLAATETILLERGFAALSTREISRLAQSNVSQIRYYFDGMDGLLDALILQELETVSEAFAAIHDPDFDESLEDLLKALLAAVRVPAPFTEGGFAAIAIEELFLHASPQMREKAGQILNQAHEPIIAALSRHVPGMDELTLRIRFSATIATAISMLPRSGGRRLLALSEPGRTVAEDTLVAELEALALATFGC